MQFLNLFVNIDYKILVASMITPLALFIFFVMDGVKFKNSIALIINIVATYLILSKVIDLPLPFSGLLMECIYAVTSFFVAKRKLEILIVAPLYVISCYTTYLFGYIYAIASYITDNSRIFEEIYIDYFFHADEKNAYYLEVVCFFIALCIFLILFRRYLNRQFEYIGSINGVFAMIVSFICCVMVSALFTISMSNERDLFRSNKDFTRGDIRERFWMCTAYIVLTALTVYYIFRCYRNMTAMVFDREGKHNNIFSAILSLFGRKKEVQVERPKTYLEEMETMYTEMRGYKHDLANIMSLMSGYFFSDNYPALKKYYFATVLPSIKEVTIDSYRLNQLKNIKNEAIKSVVYNKVSMAHARGVNVGIEIIEPIDAFYIGDIDLGRILGIFFDNALEALEEAPDKELVLSIIKTEHNICIIIANTFVPSDKVSMGNIDKKGVSSKGDNRGMGLYNVSKILAKYPHIYKTTSIDGGFFTQKMEINKEQLEKVVGKLATTER